MFNFNRKIIKIAEILFWEEPTEEIIEIPEISTFDDNTVISVETKIEPSKLSVNYWRQIGVDELSENIVQNGSNILIISTGDKITQSGNNLTIGDI